LSFRNRPVYNINPLNAMLREEVLGMPVYEYECSACGGRFEALQKFSDSVLTECRLCKVGRVRKVLSPPAFVLKGSGWYVTDYPSADRKKSAEAEKPASSSPDAKTPACSGTCTSGTCASKE
jgi:putative FmdB family regulatory protein